MRPPPNLESGPNAGGRASPRTNGNTLIFLLISFYYNPHLLIVNSLVKQYQVLTPKYDNDAPPNHP